MRILVIGAGETGAHVLRQLQKNPALTLITADPRPRPFAVKQAIISAVDITDPLTPFNLEQVIAQAQPDLVLLTRSLQDMGLGLSPGLDLFSEQLGDELAALSSVPLIQVVNV